MQAEAAPADDLTGHGYVCVAGSPVQGVNAAEGTGDIAGIDNQTSRIQLIDDAHADTETRSERLHVADANVGGAGASIEGGDACVLAGDDARCIDEDAAGIGECTHREHPKTRVCSGQRCRIDVSVAQGSAGLDIEGPEQTTCVGPIGAH